MKFKLTLNLKLTMKCKIFIILLFIYNLNIKYIFKKNRVVLIDEFDSLFVKNCNEIFEIF